MKRGVVIIVMLICCIPSFSDTIYWTVHDSIYQIYKAPDEQSEILGTTEKISLLSVAEIINDWAKINYTNESVAYVKSSCLGSIENNEKVKEARLRAMYEKNSMFFYAIVLTTLILCVASIVRRYFICFLTGSLFYFKWVVLIILSILWTPFIFNCLDLTFFINFLFEEYPLCAIIAFIIAPLIQVISFWKLKEDINENSKTKLNILFGVCSMVIGSVILLILTVWSLSAKWFAIVFVLTELCQIIQSILIFKTVKKNREIIFSIFCALTYFIGVHSSLFAVIVVVILGLLLLWTYLLVKFGAFLIRAQLDVSFSAIKRLLGFR